jgi:hypothetical protein
MKWIAVTILSLTPCCSSSAQGTLPGHAVGNQTTAWHDGEFRVDVAGVIGRSDIVLGRVSCWGGRT